MNAKFYRILWVLLFYSFHGISQCPIATDILKPDPIEYSYDNEFLDYTLVTTCNTTEAEKFYYSLNGGGYKKFDVGYKDISHRFLKIDTLLLEKETNILTILYGSCTTDVKFIYSKPEIKINSVLYASDKSPLEINNNVYVVRNSADILIDFKAETKSYDGARGSSVTESLEYKIGNSDGSYTSISGFTGNFKIDKTKLVPGENLVFLRAKGKGTGIEYSDLKVVRIFYIGFQLPQEFGSNGEIWKDDKLIKLSGQPNGGWFTGSGIVGNSNYFNPTLMTANSGKITYNFPYNGITLTSDQQVKIIYDSFDLEGSQSVWRNSSDVEYEIVPRGNTDLKNFTSYEWKCIYGKPDKIITLLPVNTITWDRDLPVGENIGKVSVTGTHTSGAKYTSELSVFINNNVAYNKPELFFGNNDETLVVCSDTKAYFYKWYVDGVLQKVPSVPYLYYTGIGNLVKVEIITDKGAVTSKEITRSKKMSAKLKLGDEDQLVGFSKHKNLVIYPNLAVDVINVVFNETESTSRIRVFDSSAKLVLETQTAKGIGTTQINTSKFPPGRYFVQLVNSSGIISEPFVKIN